MEQGIAIVIHIFVHHNHKWTWMNNRVIDWTGLDWTGLDWTGLDWTGVLELRHDNSCGRVRIQMILQLMKPINRSKALMVIIS
jgi:hypothetical protein